MESLAAAKVKLMPLVKGGITNYFPHDILATRPIEFSSLSNRLDSAGRLSTLAVSCILSTFLLLIVWAIAQKSPSSQAMGIALTNEFRHRKERVEQYRFNSREILNKGYRQFKGQIFGIDTSEGTTIVLPLHFMDELKSNPALTFGASFDILSLPRYTRTTPVQPNGLKTFTAKLNPTLRDFIPLTQSLYRHEFSMALPKTTAWEVVKFILCCSTWFAKVLLECYCARLRQKTIRSSNSKRITFKRQSHTSRS